MPISGQVRLSNGRFSLQPDIQYLDEFGGHLCFDIRSEYRIYSIYGPDMEHKFNIGPDIGHSRNKDGRQNERLRNNF